MALDKVKLAKALDAKFSILEKGHSSSSADLMSQSLKDISSIWNKLKVFSFPIIENNLKLSRELDHDNIAEHSPLSYEQLELLPKELRSECHQDFLSSLGAITWNTAFIWGVSPKEVEGQHWLKKMRETRPNASILLWYSDDHSALELFKGHPAQKYKDPTVALAYFCHQTKAAMESYLGQSNLPDITTIVSAIFDGFDYDPNDISKAIKREKKRRNQGTLKK